MKIEVNPEETSRAEAFKMWMTSPMPMVTLVKTIDVSRLLKVSRKRQIKFNVLLRWCIGKAACRIEEFYYLPTNGKLYKYEQLGINVIVKNSKGGITLCDIPFCDDISAFNSDYLRLTDEAARTCISTSIEDRMIIGTSALPQLELDCIVNQYSGIYNNPFLAWGKYRKRLFRTTLPISFQFHHAQMDGEQACAFLKNLQEEIDSVTL